MAASTPSSQLVHTRFWKDQDLNRNRASVIRPFRRKSPYKRCACVDGVPLAGICMLHYEMGRETFDSSFLSQPLLSAHDVSNATTQNTLPTNEGASVNYSDIENDCRCESQLPPCLHCQRRALECSKFTWSSEPNAFGRAEPYTETGAVYGPGISPSELRPFCNVLKGDTGTGEIDGENAMFWQVEAPANNAPHMEGMSSDITESNVSEYQNWVWWSFSNWIDYMYPDASRDYD
ncbi:hypothetical protein BGZ63DRAFT_445523 [Mariannaea sp. PMI_226]|nr:hypothetical protein BGZ63DRAFT_445523 [Mariannaea sp. PMI_226]